MDGLKSLSSSIAGSSSRARVWAWARWPWARCWRATASGPALTAPTAGHRGRQRRRRSTGGLPGLPHFAPKAKRVIYLFQSGAPSQMDLFDYKPATRRAAGGSSCPTRCGWASGSRR